MRSASWPWFGPDPGCQGHPGHGFARNRLWNLAATEATKNGDIKVILGLVDTHETPSYLAILLQFNAGNFNWRIFKFVFDYAQYW